MYIISKNTDGIKFMYGEAISNGYQVHYKDSTRHLFDNYRGVEIRAYLHSSRRTSKFYISNNHILGVYKIYRFSKR